MEGVRTSVRHRWPDLPSEAVAPSILRRFITGDRLTVAQFELKKGGVVPRHSHDQEQITCVLRGALRFDIDGRQVVVRQDEVLQIPGGVEHGITCPATTSASNVIVRYPAARTSMWWRPGESSSGCEFGVKLSTTPTYSPST